MGDVKKTEEQLREEIAQEFNWTEEDNEEQIDKVLELKKDRYAATQAKKKAQEEANLLKKGKDFYKSQIKSKEDKSQLSKKENKEILPLEDRTYLLTKGYSRTELRHLEKVMQITGKKWEKAVADNLFTTFKTENDAIIKRRGSQLEASHGGGSISKAEQDKLVEKFSKDLPKDFRPSKK